ncbi:MAG TPA: hypothetical protein VG711_05495, partial [Phycisphaerales bacterium]|nr:hypothetical protein [Phycisphaerales bacterium]
EGVHGGWVAQMVYGSSARAGLAAGEHETAAAGGILGMDPHKAMYFVSGAIGLIGIAIAWYYHLANRKAADALRARLLASPTTRWLPVAMENKWYVDEMYNLFIRGPLWIIALILYMFDRYVIDMLFVDGVATLPRGLGKSFQPLANGAVQSYAVSMAGGVGLVAILILFMPDLMRLISNMVGGGG